MIGCKECPDLKKWYHGPHSNFGMFSYSCARTGYNIEDPEQIACGCPIGCNSEHHVACRSCTDPMRGMYAYCPLYLPEVIPDGTP